ncbi:MAG: 3-phosphoshikimate 1-carboxyvinyltransferase [Clostridia bacterium]|nr:3-phosphoshikimate 1-carboxyvinyltransferase [Clostridia bacterium]
MNVIVSPAKLSGTVTVPPSKSVAHRMLIGAALAEGPTEVLLSAFNRDIDATMNCLRALGTDIDREQGALILKAPERIVDPVVMDCHESGSTLRFMLPVVLALGLKARFIGRGRLPERPNAPLVDALRDHGARIDSDRLPMGVKGPIDPGLWRLPGNVSSQYITGLMLALPLLPGDSRIVLTSSLESSAYVNITRRVLERFGIDVRPEADGWFVPGHQRYHSPGCLQVEGDWSSAAFWLAANAMGAGIDVKGLDPQSAQGDRAITDLLKAPEVDVRHVPDLVPALAVAAGMQAHTIILTGAARLRLKESDRLTSVSNMMRALGHRTVEGTDSLTIFGGASIPSEAPIRTVDGANDHRIVMAAAIGGSYSDRPVRILGAEAVDKSYPDFFQNLKALGGTVHVESVG